jgi:hypothetical protein
VTARVLSLEARTVAIATVAGGVAGLVAFLLVGHTAGMVAALLVFAGVIARLDM